MDAQYLSFIDSDDWVEPEFLSVLHRTLTEAGADVAVCGFVEFSDATESCAVWHTGVLRGAEIVQKYMRGEIYNRIFNKLYRMELVKGIRFPEYKSAMEDAPWQAKVMTEAQCVARVSDTLYHYRVRQGSIMRQHHSSIVRQGTVMDAFGRADIILSWLSDQYARSNNKSEQHLLDEITDMALVYFCGWIHTFAGASAVYPDSDMLFQQLNRLSSGYAGLPSFEQGEGAEKKYCREMIRLILQAHSLPMLRRNFLLFEVSHHRFLSALKTAGHYLLEKPYVSFFGRTLNK